MERLHQRGLGANPASWSGSMVLDPTCGSCGLLLAAAALGASTLVGVDCDADAFPGSAAEFERHCLPVPRLTSGDVLAPHSVAELTEARAYDAIVCDPPYGMRAPVVENGQVAAARSSDEAAADRLTGAVLALAEHALSDGGRLAILVPARGADVALDIEPLLESRLPKSERPRLRLLHGRRQQFSTRRSRRAGRAGVPRASTGGGAFVRWLCCFEARDEQAAAPASLVATGSSARSDGNPQPTEVSPAQAPSMPLGAPAVPPTAPAVPSVAAEAPPSAAVAAPLSVYEASRAMSLHAKAGEWAAALAILDALEAPDTACYHAALAACERAGRPAEAFALLDEMQRTSVPLTAACFTSAGRAAAAAGRFSDALEAFERIGQRGLPCGFSDYRAALVACSRGGGGDAADLASRAMALARRPAQREWLWKQWRAARLLQLEASLRAQLGRRGLQPDATATSDLHRALKVAAKSGRMPSFESSGGRTGYTVQHLQHRVAKSVDTLRLDQPAWLGHAVDAVLDGGQMLASVGGGPGYDHAALRLLQLWRAETGGAGEAEPEGGSATAMSTAAVDGVDGAAPHPASHGDRGEATRVAEPAEPRGAAPAASSASALSLVLDYELGWQAEFDALVAAVDETTHLAAGSALAPRAAHFGRTDITQPLDAPSNQALHTHLSDVRLVVASYVVAENAVALEGNGFAFFEGLLREAAVGTVLLVLETTHRSFGHVVAAAQRGVDGAADTSGRPLALQVECPWVHSNGGFSLLLHKMEHVTADGMESGLRSRGFSKEVRELLDTFERDRVRAAPSANAAAAS